MSAPAGALDAPLVERVRERLANTGAEITSSVLAAAVRAEAGGVVSDVDVLAALRLMAQEFSGAGPLDPLLHDPATRHQGELFGSVASDTTVWRMLDEVDPVRLSRIAQAWARARRQVWRHIQARHGRIPPARVAGRDLGAITVIRLDASIVLAHSEKQQASGTFKGTFGFHPLTAWCDNTDESLVVKLRPGRAGANTAADHIEVLNAAIFQIPVANRYKMSRTASDAAKTPA